MTRRAEDSVEDWARSWKEKLQATDPGEDVPADRGGIGTVSLRSQNTSGPLIRASDDSACDRSDACSSQAREEERRKLVQHVFQMQRAGDIPWAAARQRQQFPVPEPDCL